MPYQKKHVVDILKTLQFGSTIAESDDLLEAARVETSAFSDLLNDRVDLVSGTKGSGKSALYRIFTDFLPSSLLRQRKVIVAHGVHPHGDSVFHAFSERFDELSEDDFVNFWCVYLISLARDSFVRNDAYGEYLEKCSHEVRGFLEVCKLVRIPEAPVRRPLRDVLNWALDLVRRVRPKVSYETPDGGSMQMELPFDGEVHRPIEELLPTYVTDISDKLEQVLACANLHLWLMVDRLDEVFLRRSDTETRALRALLKTSRSFRSERIRLKIFLRDDIFDQITNSPEGFTALTHVTARSTDPLRWSEDQILTLITNRLFASERLVDFLGVDKSRLSASQEYRMEAFYLVFPKNVRQGKRQSSTLRWIYNHTMDGRDVVTPRDVIQLLERAKQRQQSDLEPDSEGECDSIIGPNAILYGFDELSKRKKDTYLKAEFPHFWPDIERFMHGKSEYTEAALEMLLGENHRRVRDDLIGIGLLRRSARKGQATYMVPQLYRKGLELTQGLTDETDSEDDP